MKNPYPGSFYAGLNGSMWTISYEFHCYIMVLVLGIFGILQRRLVVFFCTITLILAYLVHPEIYVTPNYNLSRMAVGAQAYVPHSFSRLLRSAVIEGHSADIRLFGIFLVGSCFNLFQNRLTYKSRYAVLAFISLMLCMFSNHLAEPGLAIFGGYLMFWFALEYKPLKVSKFFDSTDLSYGIYLYGWPVQKTLIRLMPSIDPYAVCLLTLCICAVIAYFSWKFIEKPCIRLKHRVRLYVAEPAKTESA